MKLSKEFLTIGLIMLTEILGWSLILPFLPYYAKSFGASPLIVGLLIASFSIFQFISAPIIGKLSDKYGRKPLLILSQLSTLIGFIILGFANSLFMIFLSRIIDGLFGSNMTLSRAYITDISKGKDRAKMFGFMGVVFGIGFFIGPAIGGLLASIDYSIPAFVAAGIVLVSIFLTCVFLRETVSDGHSIRIRLNDFFPMKIFLQGIREKGLRKLFLQFFLFVSAFTVITSSMALFVDYQLGFGPEDVGFLLMFIGLSRIVFQLFAFPKLVDKYSGRVLAIIGMLVLSVSMFGFYFVNSRAMLYAGVILFSTGSGLTRPMIVTRISDKSRRGEHGKFMGVTDSLMSVSQIIGPLIGGFIVENYYPGTLGLLSGALMLCALLFEFFSN